MQTAQHINNGLKAERILTICEAVVELDSFVYGPVKIGDVDKFVCRTMKETFLDSELIEAFKNYILQTKI